MVDFHKVEIVERTFVNRIDERTHLNRALEYDGNENPVLVLTGIGGMGKTALRTAFENQALKPNKVPYAVIDYDGDFNVRPIVATLRAMRRQLGRQGVKTPVFDYLYARYYELTMGVKISSSNCPPELEGVLTILEGIPAVGTVAQVIHGLSQLGLHVKERLQHKEWLYRIRELEPREVLNLLPEVLAGDLEEAVLTQTPKVLKSSGSRITLLLDAYECLSESQVDDTLHRKLLSLTPHLLRVIFTRDPLPWEHKYPEEWRSKITHFPSLEVLSCEDATLLMREKQVEDPVLHDHLYQLTRGYPFHLELCADICREITETTDKKPKIEDFQGAAQARDLTEELVHRLLRQLKDNERDLMSLACYPRWVSEEILEVLSSVPESVRRIFRKLTGLSMFSPHPEIPEAYTLRKEVRDCLLLQRRHERMFKRLHGKLSEFHREQWEQTQSFHHLQEALYHGFYEDPEQALRMFEENFWEFMERFRFDEAEGLMGAIPQEMLDEKAKRKIDYARARLLTATAHSQQSLITAKNLYEALIASETDEDSLGRYLLFSADLLRIVGEYEKALEHNEKALAIRLKIYGEEHTDVATSYHNISIIYDEQAEYAKALEYYQKALAIRLKIYGEEHPDVATSYNDIGIIYREQGQYDKALEYGQKSLSIRQIIFGKEDPAAAISSANIGSVYYYQHKYAEALEYYQRSHAIVLKGFGEEHPNVATSYNNIGCVCYAQGEYGKGLEYSQKALAIRLKVYGEEHPYVADCYNNIGNAYNEQNEYRKALEYYQKALAVYLKVFNEDHPRVADSYHNIGFIYRKQGEYKKALEYYQKSLTIYLKVYGEEHPELAGSHYEIACTLYALNRVEEAFERIRQSIEMYCKSRLWKDAVEVLDDLRQWLEEKGKNNKAQDVRAEADKIRRDHALND